MRNHPQKSKKDAATIIPADDSHVSQIVELWKEFIDFHKEIDPFCTRSEDGPKNFEKFVRDLIESEDAHVVVALDGDSVVAYSICDIGEYPPVLRHKKFGFISDMAVKATHRRKGIGELLLARMLDWCESRNLDRIELHVVHGNKIGHSFWTKHGFKDCRHTLYIEREKS